MDYETKLLLNRLVEEVDKLNSPDWWMILIAIANMIFVVLLGCWQYKLQKQQTKIQEHEVYKNLYSLIKSINNIGGSVVHTAFYVLKDTNIEEFGIRHLQNKRKALNDLSLKLSEFEIDLELKTDIKNIEYANYEFFLGVASALIMDIIFFIKDTDISPLNIDKNVTFNEKEMIDLLLANTVECKRNFLKKQFEDYIKLKTRIGNYKILESLKKRSVL